MVPDFDAATSYQQIEAEVLELFNRSDIVTPDEVRGNYSTLAEAVLTDSRYGCSCWPQLAQQVFVCLCCLCRVFYAILRFAIGKLPRNLGGNGLLATTQVCTKWKQTRVHLCPAAVQGGLRWTPCGAESSLYGHQKALSTI